jgi:NAD(P)-dependent dehydrogenase (short-subunit alcohol dehydrogenase family)
MTGANRLLRLAGRRILVTGAASGIGLTVAKLFRSEGCAVAMTDVQPDDLIAAAESLGVVPLTADLLDFDALPGVVAAAADALGGLDGLVNCAGVMAGATLADIEMSTWERVLGVNLTAPCALCKAAFPWLLESPDSSIVNVSSGMGLLPDLSGRIAYAASNGGLIAFTRALAAEAAPRIRVNAVCSGTTRTPMAQHRIPASREEEAESPIAQRHAMKRIGEPEEIAAAVLFLSSSESSCVTGATLTVDGGRTFH